MNITTEFATFVIFILGVVAGAWWRVEGAIKVAKDEAKKDAEAAATKAEAAVGLHNMLSIQLAEHKLHVAETYITKAGLREFRDEVMTGVRELKGSVSTLHQRIDQILHEKGREA
ncbi:hypothetical protein [Mesorhizobium sp. CN2-181]|uniref:hypothetical protein n=1 Tax=Mesorhizobium yinganensis TaxID=3157707 RepID=UPI0032B79111